MARPSPGTSAVSVHFRPPLPRRAKTGSDPGTDCNKPRPAQPRSATQHGADTIRALTRHIVKFLAPFSLLLWVVVCVHWALSYRPKSSDVTLNDGQWGVGNWSGRVWVLRHARDADTAGLSTSVEVSQRGRQSVVTIYGFEFEPDPRRRRPGAGRLQLIQSVDLSGGGDLENAAGFGAVTGRLSAAGFERHPPVFRAVAVPHWFLALLTAAAPAAWLRVEWTRERRWRKNLCPSCGYDLRASPGRCPECGASSSAGERAWQKTGSEGQTLGPTPGERLRQPRRRRNI